MPASLASTTKASALTSPSRGGLRLEGQREVHHERPGEQNRRAAREEPGRASSGRMNAPTIIAIPASIIKKPAINIVRNLHPGGYAQPMGMFKDLRDLNRAGMEETKKRGGMFKMMKDGLAQANEMVQDVRADQALAEALANDGVDGTATINSMVATGTQINMQPELQFELTVDVNGHQSQVTHRQVVSPAVIGQLQPGATVACKVDPSDPSKLMIGI